MYEVDLSHKSLKNKHSSNSHIYPLNSSSILQGHGGSSTPTFPSNTVISKNIRLASQGALCDLSAGIFIATIPCIVLAMQTSSAYLTSFSLLHSLFHFLNPSFALISSWRSVHIFTLPALPTHTYLCLANFYSSVKKSIQMSKTHGHIFLTRFYLYCVLFQSFVCFFHSSSQSSNHFYVASLTSGPTSRCAPWEQGQSLLLCSAMSLQPLAECPASGVVS